MLKTGCSFCIFRILCERSNGVHRVVMQTDNGISFIGQNILLIGIVGLVMFIYVLFLVRKRFRKNFLHDPEEKSK